MKTCSFALLSLFAVATAAANPLAIVAQRKEVTNAVWSDPVGVAKVGVAMSWVAERKMPRDIAGLGEIGEEVPPDSVPELGIGSLRIDRGTIIVTLGGKVHDDLAGKVVALTPCVTDHDVRFVCGRAQCSGGYTRAVDAPDGSQLTTLEPLLLPPTCR